jgi:DNA-binding transcriptional regulator YiaG
MDDIPRVPFRKRWVNEAGEVLCNTMPAGEPLVRAAALLIPNGEQSRKSLLRIRRSFRISRAQLAVCLGVARDTLRSWETGERTPSTAARRLIQLVEGIFFSEETRILGFGGLMIGHLDYDALQKTRLELVGNSETGLVV